MPAPSPNLRTPGAGTRPHRNRRRKHPPTIGGHLNAEVQLEDLDSGERLRYRLVLPRETRAAHDISILAPVGTAILGYRAGDIVEWPVPKGIRRLKIHEVVPPPAT